MQTTTPHAVAALRAWPCVFLSSRRADADLTGPFLRPPASTLAGAALQALRELGIDCSDRNNVVNERNGKSGSAVGCLDDTLPAAWAFVRERALGPSQP